MTGIAKLEETNLMTDDFNPSEWITTKEAATLTGYEPAHIRYLARKGTIKGKKFGRDWMISRSSVAAYVAEAKRLGTAKHDPWRTGARHVSTEKTRTGKAGA